MDDIKDPDRVDKFLSMIPTSFAITFAVSEWSLVNI